MTCTFFGHRDTTNIIEPTLRSTLINLIENENVDMFYVGNQGAFDLMALRLLKNLSSQYPIKYYNVLAYIPSDNNKNIEKDYSKTIVPEGIENVPRRFAIIYRNKWLIKKSDYVITHVNNTITSKAADFKRLAEKSGKIVINI